MKGLKWMTLCAAAAVLVVGCGENTAAPSQASGESAATAVAAGGGKVCINEFSATVMGERVGHLDCVEATGGDASDLREMCDDMAEMSAAVAEMGGDVEVHSQSTRMADRCPGNTQGRCEGLMNGRFNIHYGDRSEAEIEQTRMGCEQMGGRWHG